MPPQPSRHVRPSMQAAAGQQYSSQQGSDRRQGIQQPVLPNVREEVRALNSSVLVLSQKLNFIVRNEKILGRNLVVLGKKLNDLDSKIDSSKSGSDGIPKEELQKVFEAIDDNGRRVAEIESALAELRENIVLMDKFQELKYVIDSINPLDFVTIKQLDSFVEKKVLEMKSKKKI